MWKQKITRAIHESDFFLACFSKSSITKRGFLQKEIRDALTAWQEKLPDDIYLIPVRLEECEIPQNLADFQWVDLFKQTGWPQLLRAVQVGSERRTGLGRLRSSRLQALSAPVASKKIILKEQGTRWVYAGSFDPVSKEGAHLPLVTFPSELSRFAQRVSPATWAVIDEATQRFLITLGTKLEPIMQIVPHTPVRLVIGFESLALGSLGENFKEICDRTMEFDAGLLRLLLILAAMKTISTLRINAAQDGSCGVRHLIFTMNLDPEMLDCPHLDDLLDRYRHCWEHNVLFEINERTSTRYLQRLKRLQSDFALRYCADDFNNWSQEVKDALESRVEMTKLDYQGFRKAMAVRGDDPHEAIARIAACKVSDKPLVVEGIEEQNHIRFLDQHWPFAKHGSLFGQGYLLAPGYPWDAWTTDLRNFGLPGGHFLSDAQPVPGGRSEGTQMDE